MAISTTHYKNLSTCYLLLYQTHTDSKESKSYGTFTCTLHLSKRNFHFIAVRSSSVKLVNSSVCSKWNENAVFPTQNLNGLQNSLVVNRNIIRQDKCSSYYFQHVLVFTGSLMFFNHKLNNHPSVKWYWPYSRVSVLPLGSWGCRCAGCRCGLWSPPAGQILWWMKRPDPSLDTAGWCNSVCPQAPETYTCSWDRKTDRSRNCLSVITHRERQTNWFISLSIFK